MKRFVVALIVIIIIFGGAYGLKKYSAHQQSVAPSFDYRTVPQNLQGTSYTREEVALHKTANDCWMVIAEKVFNVTPEIAVHPGGKIITLGCGKDATSLFYMRPSTGDAHGADAINQLHDLYIGELKQ